MKSDDVLRKKLQSVDNGRVRGRLKGNFGYMRSDEMARVQEMKKKAKTSVSHILDESQFNQSTSRPSKVIFNEKALKMFQIQVPNHIPKRKCDPEVIIQMTDLRVLRTEAKVTPEVELDFEVSSCQESSSQNLDPKMAPDILVV